MTAFELNHAYSARRDGRQFGPWQAGEVVDLEQADAEWVERDSPGALRQPRPEPEADGEREKPAGANRQHRGGRNRSS